MKTFWLLLLCPVFAFAQDHTIPQTAANIDTALARALRSFTTPGSLTRDSIMIAKGYNYRYNPAYGFEIRDTVGTITDIYILGNQDDQNGTGRIQAALNVGSGTIGSLVERPTVHIPIGKYLINATIHVPSNSVVECAPHAIFDIYDNFTDTCLALGREVKWRGGTIRRSVGTVNDYIAFSINTGDGVERDWSRVENVDIYDCNIGIDIHAIAAAANGNVFSNIKIHGAKSAIRVRESGSFADANMFRDIQFQSSPTQTLFGIDSLAGSENVFDNCFFYDMPSGSKSVITSSANNTTLVGGFMDSLIDNSATTTMVGTYLGKNGITNIAKVPGVLLGVSTIADSTISWARYNNFTKTISGNQRFVFTNITEGQLINVAVTCSGTHTVTWVTAVTWKAGSAPTQTADKTDIYTFFRLGGVTYGSASQNY
jgi:hypothetical protein